MAPMSLFLVPLVGPFHRRFPRYNAVTVREVVTEIDPDVLATTALSEGAFERPDWRDVDEPGLAAAVAWAEARRRRVAAVGEPSPDPSAPGDFVRYLQESGSAGEVLAEIDEVERSLAELLQGVLDLDRIRRELDPLVETLHDRKVASFGDGPGTDWLEERAATAAARVIALEGERIALLVPIDQAPALRRVLRRTLPRDVPLEDAPAVPPSDAARRRALIDAAFLGRADDAASLLTALREVEGPEARLAEAETLLGHGHAAEALDLLIETTREDFSEPPYLPGWLLARLGQLYDLDGRREEAKKAYRGVLALGWAPAPARDAARDGLERPFVAASDAVQDGHGSAGAGG